MKIISATFIAIACVLGLVVADYGYGSFGGMGGGYGHGGYSFVPVTGGAGGLGNGGLLTLIGVIFLLLILFGQQNTATGGNTPTVTTING